MNDVENDKGGTAAASEESRSKLATVSQMDPLAC